MAEKGARARLETVARQMYVDGTKLTEIEELLGVSRQTLSDWKARTKRSGDEFDEWDQARESKKGRLQRLELLFDRELLAHENTAAGQVSAAGMDALAKIGSLIKSIKGMERPDLYQMVPPVMEAFVAFVQKSEKNPDRQAIVFAMVDRFFDEVKPSGI